MTENIIQSRQEQAQSEQFASIPVPSITAHKDLGSTAKLVYGLLRRLQKINEKRGKAHFRLSHAKLAQQIGRTPRTVRRAIRELREAQLIVSVRTGRSNYYSLLPVPNVENSDLVQKPEVREDKNVLSERTKMAAPHKRSLPEKKDIYALSPAATAEQGSEEKTAATAAEKQREKEFLEGWRETEYGKYLISRIKLLGFDWD